eukprot:6125386-Amphidinium_carterae.1
MFEQAAAKSKASATSKGVKAASGPSASAVNKLDNLFKELTEKGTAMASSVGAELKCKLNLCDDDTLPQIVHLSDFLPADRDSADPVVSALEQFQTNYAKPENDFRWKEKRAQM